MAFNFGQFTEFSDSVTIADPTIEALARAIELGPYEGQFYQAMGAPMAPIRTREYDVYSRSKTARKGTIDANWDDDDVSGLGVSDTSLAGLSIGMVLDIGGEYVIVSAIDAANGQISVHSRGAGGTTAASHTSGDSFDVVGFAGTDTDLKNVRSFSETTSVYANYVQTIFETIDWTKLGDLVRKGMSPDQASLLLISEAENRVAEMLGVMAIRGKKSSASAGSGRFMSAGLLAQLSDSNRSPNTYNVNGDLTEEAFKAAIGQAVEKGAKLTTVWCNPTVKGYINAFMGAIPAVVINQEKSDKTAGGLYASRYDYEGLVLEIRVDSAMPSSAVAIVNQAKCKKGWLEGDGLRLVDEPQASSRELRKSLQGSVGFIVEDVGTDHQYLYGITGGSSERVYKATATVSGVTRNMEIVVAADANVPTASSDNIGLRVIIKTGWTGGTKISTAVAGEVWASNGASWIKQ